MKGVKKNVLCAAALVVWCLLVGALREAHPETVDGLFSVRVVLPGATEIVDVVQSGAFPLCPQFLIFLGGQGSLGISLKNDASDSRELMFMLGMAFSAAGNFPIQRLGTSQGMISQIVEIGSGSAPYGLVWLYCGVAQADKDPVYLYELRLSFVP